MNPRIRELMKQATEPPEFPTDIGYFNPEKFAELIVSDCIQYLNNEVDRLHKYRDSLPSWGENMRYECDLFIEKCMDNVQGLKQHFGFKEPQGWVCPKCGVDRIKASCPQGHTAALTGDCPMYGIAL